MVMVHRLKGFAQVRAVQVPFATADAAQQAHSLASDACATLHTVLCTTVQIIPGCALATALTETEVRSIAIRCPYQQALHTP